MSIFLEWVGVVLSLVGYSTVRVILNTSYKWEIEVLCELFWQKGYFIFVICMKLQNLKPNIRLFLSYDLIYVCTWIKLCCLLYLYITFLNNLLFLKPKSNFFISLANSGLSFEDFSLFLPIVNHILGLK